MTNGQGSGRGRTKARRLAMQALYQRQIGGQDPKDICNDYIRTGQLEDADEDYFTAILLGVTDESSSLDAALSGFLDRPARQLDPVEQAILWIGAYELTNRPDVPFRVVINEAVELARTFGAEGSHRYVNGVLDKVAAELRADEVVATR